MLTELGDPPDVPVELGTGGVVEAPGTAGGEAVQLRFDGATASTSIMFPLCSGGETPKGVIQTNSANSPEPFHTCWRAVVTIIGVIAECGFRCTVGDLAVLRGKGR